MTIKEIVKNTIECKKPSELPVLMWVDGIRYEMKSRKLRIEVEKILKKNAFKHIIQVMPDIEEITGMTLDWPKTDTVWRDNIYARKYGAVWQNGGMVFKKFTPIYMPLENDFSLDKINQLELPDPTDPLYLSRAKERIKRNRDKYLLGYIIFTLFEKMHLIAGFSNILEGPYNNKKEFLALRDKIMEFNLKEVDVWKDAGVDGIFIADDWGSQDSLIISLKHWREYYKPCYIELIKKIHHLGMHVWLHSCGHIMPIIEDLIEMGLDVLNPIQPQANNIKEIGKRYHGEICFSGGLDIQQTLVKGSPEDIEKEVIYNFKCLSEDFGGGYIPAPANTILEDTIPENIQAIYDAVNKVNMDYFKN